MNPDITRIGKDLKKTLNSNKGLKLLNQWQCGWTDGGCLVLAKALRRWLGEGNILGVWEPVPLVAKNVKSKRYQIPLHKEDIQHHAVLQINNWLIDGDGIFTRDVFMARWNASIYRDRVELRPFDFETAQTQGVETRYDIEDATVRFLDDKFRRSAVLNTLQKSA